MVSESRGTHGVMTDRIEIREAEVAFIEETFGGLDTAELTINREELGEYELRIDVEGTVSLNKFITAITSGRVELDFSPFQTSSVEIREMTAEPKEDDIEELTQNLTQTKRANMPPIPDDEGLKTPTDNTHYQRLVNNPDSQPAKYRRLIRNEGEIARPQLVRWAERQGFEPETGGSHNASLLMLERIGEIERRGRGDDKVIIWTGE